MLIPATRYRDCEAALKFVTEVLGLTPHAVHRGKDGAILHVEIRQGQGVMMFGPQKSGAFDAFMVDPRRAGGETTTIYVVVADVAALHARVLANDADVVLPLETQDYGGSNFTVRDPEGHIWSFGDYDPLAANA
ncbi:VOC family protein [Sedimentitalea nanhaiensis]|uniref:Uncharacterized conserved protein PhnB, glyoxalase superfamily n=1 Tax=Sedimentitalea nanhaiensis TaxID=999627 RepID=A0A1I7AP61_9RHOB|nr:VOC family protein [Sedimentitalea nanhaiensis]SFT76719.1 Uncharacterized conserved protein PhnB, glyoxalase superfamily [Sedimentitalea nanhaiensis]